MRNILFVQDKADSFFTTQRLNYIANQTQLLQPRVAELRNVDIADVTSAFKALETAAKNLLRSVSLSTNNYLHIRFMLIMSTILSELKLIFRRNFFQANQSCKIILLLKKSYYLIFASPDFNLKSARRSNLFPALIL